MYCKNCGEKNADDSKFCPKCGSDLGNSLQEKQVVDVRYFAISTERLIISSLATMGLYELYWFYKNWEAIKKAEDRDILPFWRAVFNIFFCYSLFKNVLESAKRHGYTDLYSPGWLAAIYIGLSLIGNGFNRNDLLNPHTSTVWVIVSLAVSFLPLLRVQEAINFNNEKINGGNVYKQGYSKGEIIWLVFGVLLFLAVLVNKFLS